MFERFTDRARKVMDFANQKAQRYNHDHIGTEHILLGLVMEGSGVGANVLKNLGIGMDKVRIEVEKVVKPGSATPTSGMLPQTPLAKKALEQAIAEARGLNHNYVGTEHVLLGLLSVTEGIAAIVLANLRVDLDATRKGIIDLLGTGTNGGGACAIPSETRTQPQIVGFNEGNTFRVLGTLTRMILTRAQTGGAMTLFEQSGLPGQGVPLHVHQHEDEFFRVLEGQVRFAANMTATLAGPGDTLYGPRRIPHEWFFAGDKPSKVLIATLPGTAFENMLVELGKLPPGPPDMAKVTEICGRAGVTFVG
ncbi:MAG: cupin domain-containing protein [Planctomycetes bacterium]|nr:cupin domain-containing protein [Planctomycetota bacterium]